MILMSKKEAVNNSFETEKKKLRECYKLVKAGLISPDDIDRRTKYLLLRYYGMEVGGKK